MGILIPHLLRNDIEVSLKWKNGSNKRLGNNIKVSLEWKKGFHNGFENDI